MSQNNDNNFAAAGLSREHWSIAHFNQHGGLCVGVLSSDVVGMAEALAKEMNLQRAS
jgi:hypothetical protein